MGPRPQRLRGASPFSPDTRWSRLGFRLERRDRAGPTRRERGLQLILPQWLMTLATAALPVF